MYDQTNNAPLMYSLFINSGVVVSVLNQNIEVVDQNGVFSLFVNFQD